MMMMSTFQAKSRRKIGRYRLMAYYERHLNSWGAKTWPKWARAIIMAQDPKPYDCNPLKRLHTAMSDARNGIYTRAQLKDIIEAAEERVPLHEMRPPKMRFIDGKWR